MNLTVLASLIHPHSPQCISRCFFRLPVCAGSVEKANICNESFQTVEYVFMWGWLDDGGCTCSPKGLHVMVMWFGICLDVLPEVCDGILENVPLRFCESCSFCDWIVQAGWKMHASLLFERSQCCFITCLCVGNKKHSNHINPTSRPRLWCFSLLIRSQYSWEMMQANSQNQWVSWPLNRRIDMIKQFQHIVLALERSGRGVM